MELGDPTAAECLRILLEDQCRNLRMVTGRIELLHGAATQATQGGSWAGIARVTHNQLAEQMLWSLAEARDAVSRAADESARAAATLAGRVG